MNRASIRHFEPAFCPLPNCPSASPGAQFRYRNSGSYLRDCDRRKVQRFYCHACRRRFSAQSFRLNYRFRKPQIDAWVFRCMVSKVTHRQTARLLEVDRKTIHRRLHRFAPALHDLHRGVLDCARDAGGIRGSFSLDELETFEGSRRLCPVTVPALIERRSLFVVHLETGMLGARGHIGKREIAKRAERERTIGKRRSESRAMVGRCFARLAVCHRPHGMVEVVTDKKRAYRTELKRFFPNRVGAHITESSRRARNRSNPLFAINHTFAMMRDQVSRLVRRSWGASKDRKALKRHLWIWAAWRNYVRPITNHAPGTTPAMALGVTDKKLSIQEALRWRWPSRSPGCASQRGQFPIGVVARAFPSPAPPTAPESASPHAPSNPRMGRGRHARS